MRCYKVSTEVDLPVDATGAETVETEVVQYAATQADARLLRDEWVTTYKVKKKDVSIDETEISLAKSDVITFINGLLPLPEMP